MKGYGRCVDKAVFPWEKKRHLFWQVVSRGGHGSMNIRFQMLEENHHHPPNGWFALRL